MMATRGWSACTRTSELDVSCPWCKPSRTSTAPTRFLGHINSNSLFLVRSAGGNTESRGRLLRQRPARRPGGSWAALDLNELVGRAAGHRRLVDLVRPDGEIEIVLYR